MSLKIIMLLSSGSFHLSTRGNLSCDKNRVYHVTEAKSAVYFLQRVSLPDLQRHHVSAIRRQDGLKHYQIAVGSPEEHHHAIPICNWPHGISQYALNIAEQIVMLSLRNYHPWVHSCDTGRSPSQYFIRGMRLPQDCLCQISPGML